MKKARHVGGHRPLAGLVRDDPLLQVRQLELTCGKAEDRIGKLFLGVLQLDAVEGKKNQHDMDADPLIAVCKRVVFDQTEAQARGLLLNGRIDVGAIKRLKRSVQRRIQQCFIPQPGQSSRFRDDLLVQAEDLLFGNAGHLASTL